MFDRRADPGRLRRLDRPRFRIELTALLADMNWLHPFREVNGRACRTFAAQLSSAAGWRLTWADLDRDRNRGAARAAHDGDHTLLRALLDERLTAAPPRRPPHPRPPG